jgi:hypothetical protein
MLELPSITKNKSTDKFYIILTRYEIGLVLASIGEILKSNKFPLLKNDLESTHNNIRKSMAEVK